MNILVITATYPPSANGVAVSTKRTVQALRNLGHRVFVYGPKLEAKRTDTEYMSAPTMRIPLFGLADYPIALPHSLGRMLRLLPKRRWDVIHVHHPVIAGPFAVRLGRMLHVPVVFTYHTRYDQYFDHLVGLPVSWRTFLHRWLYKGVLVSSLRRFNGVIATTRWLRTFLQKTIPDFPIYYATTAGLSHPFLLPGAKSSLRKQLGITVSGPLLLCVSRLSVEKRTVTLLRGFLYWAATHAKGTLVIVGDGGNRANLEALCRQSPHGSRVIFVGKILNEHLPIWYSSADLFLYSSITDTIGINILEAMSAGVPVVAPNHETTREVIVSGYNGILCAHNDSSMSKAIDAALKIRAKLSRGAKETARQYHIDTTIKQLVRVYEDIIRTYKSHQ